jgi:hypothetical protein
MIIGNYLGLRYQTYVVAGNHDIFTEIFAFHAKASLYRVFRNFPGAKLYRTSLYFHENQGGKKGFLNFL